MQQPLDAGVVGDIAGLGERAAAKHDDFRGGFTHQVLAPSGGDDVCAGLGQSASEGETDTAGSPDDHGRLVCKIKKRMTHAILL